MKLTILLAFLFSFQVMAGDCAKALFDKDGPYRTDRIVKMENSKETFNRKRVAIWNDYFGYDKLTKHCIKIMDVLHYKLLGGTEFVEVTTNSDECDGGNVYGLIFDLENNVVAEITDHELVCPKP